MLLYPSPKAEPLLRANVALVLSSHKDVSLDKSVTQSEHTGFYADKLQF